MSKLLCLCDTPTVNTGFACVVRNLLPHWLPHFERIDIWGINYDGWPHDYPYRIFPAGWQWSKPRNLDRFLRHIKNSDYTHLWILQDTFLLSDNNLPKCLSELCREKSIRIVTYFPVDAPMDEQWLEIVRVSDVAATFTNYGKKEAEKFLHGATVEVMPHGADTKTFFPMTEEDRVIARAHYFPDWGYNCNILVNVNRNERRKAMVNSLQVLKCLIDGYGRWFKLYLHCLARNPGEGLDLYQIGKQLGLEYGMDWLAPHEEDFKQASGIFYGIGGYSVEELNAIYNAADCCITTSLGEGWGLSITEAAAAGLRVVAPYHTSIPDLQNVLGDRVSTVPTHHTAVVNPDDNSRVRHAVCTDIMAGRIANVTARPRYERLPLSDWSREYLSWERIAKDWLKLLQP